MLCIGNRSVIAFLVFKWAYAHLKTKKANSAKFSSFQFAVVKLKT
ncbi:hypothetical protein APA_3903 [Pseudanabaena sp. lw0831]|nr:hypothetical protein APA_3903 [Pseudanabaena sp. lw0831]